MLRNTTFSLESACFLDRILIPENWTQMRIGTGTEAIQRRQMAEHGYNMIRILCHLRGDQKYIAYTQMYGKETSDQRSRCHGTLRVNRRKGISDHETRVEREIRNVYGAANSSMSREVKIRRIAKKQVQEGKIPDQYSFRYYLRKRVISQKIPEGILGWNVFC